MASIDFPHPRHLAIAALDLAGLPLDRLDDAFLAGAPEDDFSLEFEMPGGADLAVCFDALANHFDLLLGLPEQGDAQWRMAFALELNRALEPHMRIQRAGPQGRIELLACFKGTDLQAQDLALAVLDLCALQQRFEQAAPAKADHDEVPLWLGLRG